VVDLEGQQYVNAGSWAFGAAQYAEWNGSTFRVADHVSGKSAGDRNYRWMLAGQDPGDFFAWWKQHYMGGLRFKRPKAGTAVTESGGAPVASGFT
jgi:hypothetical protein